MRLLLLLLAAVRLPSHRVGAFGGLQQLRAMHREGTPCVDESASCEAFALAGECFNNPSFMGASCSHSCGLCDGSLERREAQEREARKAAEARYAACADEHAACELWARQGECANNPSFMRRSCRASCAECESAACHDSREECAAWAAAGECESNSQFMLKQCTFSCEMCGIEYSEACRRDPKMPPGVRKGDVDAMFTEAIERFPQFKPRVLHRDPWVLGFDSFLSAGEADHLLRVAGHDFQRSLAGDGVTPVRTSSTSWCNVPSCLNDPTFQEVRARISNLTKVPWQYAEHLQVLQYKQGQFYHDHHDQNAPRHSAWGPRLYTFYMYLSDVEKGGETRFTRLNISVAPRKGTAVLWPSVLSENPLVTDERTYHEAVDVEEGVKYGANFWVHMYEFQEALQRGCDNRDYFQDDMLAARVGKRRADATKQRSVASTT
ncbi:hypothetical protein AB1Y20_013655 [Prymnesium parvum]|uniref:Procollagen-proline 4-dioxygenase n=1 Tax=Prymnesium parvum TaxID=97485 RepID=A0AB34IG92_PRYPA